MTRMSPNIEIPEDEIVIQAIQSRGPGGQNVNKVASAVQLFFDIRASSLPDLYKERLLRLDDRRISRDGILIIRAQNFRTQERNRKEALERLADVIERVRYAPRKRRPTKPSYRARQRRLDRKKEHGRKKSLRLRIRDW